VVLAKDGEDQLEVGPERVRNEEVLRTVKKEKNVLHKINRRTANYISHILLRSCLLKKKY